MKITDAQLHHLRESFKLYDVNEDNQIDRSEMIKILRDLKVEHPEKQVDAVMAKLDSNNDGSVSFGEFLQTLRTFKSLKEIEVDDIVAELTLEKAAVDVTPTTTAVKLAAEETLSFAITKGTEAAHDATKLAEGVFAAALHKGHEVADFALEKGSEVASAVTHAAEGAREKAVEYAEAAKEKAGEYAEAAKEKAGEYAEAAKEKANEYAEAAKEKAAGYALTAGLILYSSPHEFVWRYEGSHVELVGDFTEWGKNKLPMTRKDDGHFYIVLYLAPGVYEYRFIIDHNTEWYYDILKPNVLNTGSWFINNVIVV